MVRSILLVCVQLNEGTSKRTGAILKLEIRHCRRSRFSFSPFLLLPPSSSRPALVPVHPLPPPRLSLSLLLSSFLRLSTTLHRASGGGGGGGGGGHTRTTVIFRVNAGVDAAVLRGGKIGNRKRREGHRRGGAAKGTEKESDSTVLRQSDGEKFRRR